MSEHIEQVTLVEAHFEQSDSSRVTKLRPIHVLLVDFVADLVSALDNEENLAGFVQLFDELLAWLVDAHLQVLHNLCHEVRVDVVSESEIRVGDHMTNALPILEFTISHDVFLSFLLLDSLLTFDLIYTPSIMCRQ